MHEDSPAEAEVGALTAPNLVYFSETAPEVLETEPDHCDRFLLMSSEHVTETEIIVSEDFGANDRHFELGPMHETLEQPQGENTIHPPGRAYFYSWAQPTTDSKQFDVRANRKRALTLAAPCPDRVWQIRTPLSFNFERFFAAGQSQADRSDGGDSASSSGRLPATDKPISKPSKRTGSRLLRFLTYSAN
ncbi:MAG: hypothetical protein AAGH89_11180 [Verrucomicrobiota bacterium]